MYEGMQLISLVIEHRKKNILNIDFVDENKIYKNDILTSVVIGINGAGKSFVLSNIVDIFRYISNKNYSIKYDKYYLKYSIDNEIYEIEINNKNNFMKKDGNEASNIKLPNNVMAIAFLINDKFPFKPWNYLNDEDINYCEDIYEYMGIRQVSNASWISTISKRITDCIIENSRNEGFMEVFKETLEFLDFDMKIKLNIYAEQKTFFKRKLSLDKLNKKIDGLKESNSLRAYIAREFNEEDKSIIVDFINNIAINKEYEECDGECYLEYDIDIEKKNIGDLLKYNKIIKKLIDIKFIKPPKLFLSKQNDTFSFDDCSSGEKQLIFTIINIASKIQKNSLILIDEPEISLHPNWQIGYINFIKRIFRKSFGCHIILATHSHYLVSDLEGQSSAITVLDRDNDGYIKSNLIENDTYAWSAENILYNIFGVRTTRNYYFELDLRELVEIIKNNNMQKINRLDELIKKLKKYIYDSNDPLKLIIEDAERFVENASEDKSKS